MYHHSSCIKFFELSRECLLDCRSVNLKRLSKSNVCNYKPGQTIPGGFFSSVCSGTGKYHSEASVVQR